MHIGLGKFAWNVDFFTEFRKRKGYDLLEVLPAMWNDMGDITPKVRMDYADVRMSMMEERLMLATRQNYLYGCTLLNLHGLYYSTYGSHWEWAPPCYHFRMPYWAHMDVFLGYFDRLSYLMSQGHHVCDVAVIYPVAPYEAEMKGSQACSVAFDVGSRLMATGINFDFVDNDSLARAEVKDGQLVIEAAGASYRALGFPNMEAVRWESIEKAAAFAKAGGQVIAIGKLPSASDHAGLNDSKLNDRNEEAFQPNCRVAETSRAVELIRTAFVQDVQGLDRTVQALHRKVGPRDVYLVMGAERDDVVAFRAKGKAELWDPWTGKTSALRIVKETGTGTQVALPLHTYEAQIVVFTPGQEHVNPPQPDHRPIFPKTTTIMTAKNAKLLPGPIQGQATATGNACETNAAATHTLKLPRP